MDASHSELEAIRRMLADLIARVYRIERELRIRTASAAEPSTVEPTQPSPAKPVVDDVTSANSAPPVIPPPRIPPIATTPFKTEIDSDLESRIGSHWLNRIGIAAVLIGISYFLKFAFDNNWIGPAGQVTIGLLAGIAVVVWSERFRSRGYTIFSYSLKGVGIGVLYLSLWAAFHVYSLIPSGVAFFAMLIVTAATA